MCVKTYWKYQEQSSSIVKLISGKYIKSDKNTEVEKDIFLYLNG